MRKILMFLLSAGLLTTAVNAQKVTGVVKEQQGKGLEKITITLVRAKDSAAVKYGVSDKSGAYVIIGAVPGTYRVVSSGVGYVPAYSASFELGNTDVIVPELELVKAEKVLQGVSVTSKKPMIEVKADKTILNVEGTINATGNDGLELLRKAPGVTLDKDDNISLAGKNGVQIFIDGKPSPLSGADLVAFLKSLQAAQIEAIELITNPSAKYEAAGNAGIINIKLKKNKAFGTNGSVNAGYNIGYFPKYNGGISLNNRGAKVNVYGNYNYNNSTNRSHMNIFRDVADTVFDGKTVVTMNQKSHGFKGGLDYFINKNNTFGVMINGNISDNDLNSNTNTPIISKSSGVTDRKLLANSNNVQSRDNVNFNANYRFTDSTGRELNVDADYGLFRLKGNQLLPNIYTTPNETTELSSRIYRFVAPTDIDIYTLKGDYEQNFKKGRLGVGFKVAMINTGNDFLRYNVQQIKPEIRTFDDSLSNQFKYSENINAVYANYNKQYKGYMIQVGLRVENTNSKGDSYKYNTNETVNKGKKTSFERHYTDFFPSAAITFNKNPMNQWGLSYSRRIDRPAYQDLNPFEFKLDDYTYQKGNINLKPQYTNIVSLTNTYKYRLTTSLSYSHVSDIFVQLPEVVEVSKAVMSKQNLATQDVVNLSVSYPFQYKSYSLFANLNANYSHYKAKSVGLSQSNLELKQYAATVYMQNSLKIGKKGWVTEVSGWFTTPSVWGGTFKSNTLWSVDGGVQKPILKGKGNFKLSVTDIFFSIKWRGESNFAGQRFLVNGYSESRQLRASFSWRFGSNTVKAARQRKLASEEEAKRTQSSSGIGQ